MLLNEAQQQSPAQIGILMGHRPPTKRIGAAALARLNLRVTVKLGAFSKLNLRREAIFWANLA